VVLVVCRFAFIFFHFCFLGMKHCAGCQASIDGKHLVVGPQLFHNDCFVCSGCKTNLAGKAATKRNGVLVCADCAGGDNCQVGSFVLSLFVLFSAVL
jgi:hypothetical protein